MIDISIYAESVKLEAKYKERWGKDIDYVALPNSISQEQLLLAQRRMVDTGESALAALERIRDLKNEYARYLDSEKVVLGEILCTVLIYQQMNVGFIFTLINMIVLKQTHLLIT